MLTTKVRLEVRDSRIVPQRKKDEEEDRQSRGQEKGRDHEAYCLEGKNLFPWLLPSLYIHTRENSPVCIKTASSVISPLCRPLECAPLRPSFSQMNTSHRNVFSLSVELSPHTVSFLPLYRWPVKQAESSKRSRFITGEATLLIMVMTVQLVGTNVYYWN